MGAGGRIYFSCPDVAEARGGVRIIYRHVDHLNAAGMEAWVMHEEEGFHASWFEHATRVTDRGKVMREAIKGDIVVLPEIVRPEGGGGEEERGGVLDQDSQGGWRMRPSRWLSTFVAHGKHRRQDRVVLGGGDGSAASGAVRALEGVASAGEDVVLLAPAEDRVVPLDMAV